MRYENEGDYQSPVPVAPRIVLFLLTICCVASMAFYYFKKENIVSVSQAAGLITIPFQKGMNEIGTFFFQLDQEHLKLEEAKAKIASLEAVNESLEAELLENRKMIYDYHEVQKLLDLKNIYQEYETVGASVVFNSPDSNWFSNFTIDKGASDGLEVGMNVIADGGLVGYIKEVSEHHAIVTTIINDNINVSGMQLGSEDACTVIGDFVLMKEEGLLRLGYMSSTFEVGNDTTVVTSRISDRYLPGITIGYITEVSVNSNKLASSGYLKPAVDFLHLDHVLVITTQKEIAD